jgi:hypothetical protein
VREIRTLRLMSGEGKRGAHASPRLSSTLPKIDDFHGRMRVIPMKWAQYQRRAIDLALVSQVVLRRIGLGQRILQPTAQASAAASIYP